MCLLDLCRWLIVSRWCGLWFGVVALWGGAVESPAQVAAQDQGQHVLDDAWEVIEIAGVRAGYGRFRESSLVRDGKTFREIDSVTHLRLRRLGQQMDATIRIQMTSNAQGRMVDFRTEANLGRQPTVTSGQVVGRNLEITTRQGDRSSRQQIPWSASDHGFFYEQTSLKNKPMVPGEKRSFSALLPIFHRLAQTELTAGEWSNTKLLSGAQELLPIHSRTTLAGQPFEATLWMDRTGHILRTDEPTLSQSTIRTTKAEALAGQDAAPPDLIVGTVIPLKGSPPDLSPLMRAAYRVQVASAQSGPPFPNTPNQTCKAGVKKGTWDLIVQAHSQASDLAAGPFAADRPTPADRQVSRMIEHENDVIQQLARDVPAAETELRLAAVLTQKVNAWIEQKDFSAALASAAEVARTQRGDCTEHAVLLAALARARGLPARVVLGLVHVPTLGGFGYHMWNQIWCDGEWHNFDATRASGKCGAGHIQIAVTPLDDASGLAVFLPVLKVMGGTQIELSELEK